MNFCSNCGAPLVPGDDFCRNCGTRLKRELKPKQVRNWIGLLVVGLLLGCLLATLVPRLFISNSPAQGQSPTLPRVAAQPPANPDTGNGLTAPAPTPEPYLTSTPAGTPTPLPTATPPPTPISTEGLVILYQEDFNNASSGWELRHNRNAGYRDGEMVLDAGLLADRSGDFVWSRPHLTFDNFIMEVDGRWSGGAVGGGYGIRFRYQENDNFYDFTIGNDSRYTVGKAANGNYTALLEGFSQAIDRTGGPNRFHVEAKGSELRYFMNGQYLGSVRDVEHNIGDVEFVSWTTQTGTLFEASFDNLIVVGHP